MSKKIEDKIRNNRFLGQLAKSSINWFRSKIRNFFTRANKTPANKFRPTKDPFIGGMFAYFYDPKWKDELPYWDKFPLVIPIELYDDGFLGLNLHYLPPMARAKLLDALLEMKTQSLSGRVYMQVSYHLLKATVKNELFAPCIKRYLTSHIKSEIVMINDEHWEEVAFLPTQKFQKATPRKVWEDSI